MQLEKKSRFLFFLHHFNPRRPEWDYGFHINVVCAYVMRYMWNDKINMMTRERAKKSFIIIVTLHNSPTRSVSKDDWISLQSAHEIIEDYYAIIVHASSNSLLFWFSSLASIDIEMSAYDCWEHIQQNRLIKLCKIIINTELNSWILFIFSTMTKGEENKIWKMESEKNFANKWYREALKIKSGGEKAAWLPFMHNWIGRKRPISRLNIFFPFDFAALC